MIYQEEIEGEILEIYFLKEENNFAIAKIKDSKKNKIFKAAGNITRPVVGAMITVKGFWTRHPKYGVQLKVVESECFVPETIPGLAKYLSSGFAEGIGPSTVRHIINFFKEETPHILENEIEKLALVPGIGHEKFQKIRDAWNKHKK